MEATIGKKSTKTSSTTTLPSWATNLAKGAANTISGTVAANQPNLQHITDGIVGQLPGLADKAFGDQPQLMQGMGYIGDTLGGKYLNSNPMTEAMAHQGEQDAANQVNSTFSLAGRTGGGNHAADLARGVAQAGNAVRFGQYNAERQNQQQAAGMLPSMYASQFAGVPAYLGAANAAGTLPYAGLGPLASMGNLWAGQGTTTGTQPGGWGTALLGAGAQIASGFAAASDRRLKTKIKLLRRDPDGLGWYEFAYKKAPDVMLKGVMADEVKELRPQAYIKGYVNGEYDGVNYAALGSLA